jgi:hypothetical protein
MREKRIRGVYDNGGAHEFEPVKDCDEVLVADHSLFDIGLKRP